MMIADPNRGFIEVESPFTVRSIPHADLVVLVQIMREGVYSFSVWEGVRKLDFDTGFSTPQDAEEAGKNAAEGIQEEAAALRGPLGAYLPPAVPSATLAPGWHDERGQAYTQS